MKSMRPITRSILVLAYSQPLTVSYSVLIVRIIISIY